MSSTNITEPRDLARVCVTSQTPCVEFWKYIDLCHKNDVNRRNLVVLVSVCSSLFFTIPYFCIGRFPCGCTMVEHEGHESHGHLPVGPQYCSENHILSQKETLRKIKSTDVKSALLDVALLTNFPE